MRSFWHGFLALVMPANAGEMWALVTGFATITVTAVTWRGLRSLGLTQRDMLTRATRDARASAVARAEEFAEEIIPANAEILRLLSRHAIPVYVKQASEVRFDPDNETDLHAAAQWCRVLPGDLTEQSVRLLNRLEAWAMYFVAGLADSKVAFGPCGPTFCSIVVQCYPILLLVRSRRSGGKYPNTVKLFAAWMAELEEEQRGLKCGTLLKQLGELQARGPAKDILPGPLGTDLDL